MSEAPDQFVLEAERIVDGLVVRASEFGGVLLFSFADGETRLKLVRPMSHEDAIGLGNALLHYAAATPGRASPKRGSK